jgi:hypothetical protein
MKASEAPRAGFGEGLLEAYRHCPECGGSQLRVVTDGEMTNMLCLSCHRCWHPEAGFLSRVDPFTCPGCSNLGLCLSPIVGPRVDYALARGLAPVEREKRAEMSEAMASPPIDEGFEVLSRAECMRLLATASMGRVAASVGALPTVIPVPFAVLGEAVAFPAVPGGQLDTAVRGAVVALEADHVDPTTGWSVVVTGIATEVDEPETLRTLEAIPAL